MSKYAFFSEKTKIKLFVRKEKSTNTEYSLRNTVMIDRDKLLEWKRDQKMQKKFWK